MKNRVLICVGLALFLVGNVQAATNVVIQGDALQVKIDSAGPGDTLVVQAGVYSGNLNFSKPITIVRSGTNQLQLTGAASITTTGLVSISQVQFANTLTAQTNAHIALYQVNCVGAVSLSGGCVFLASETQLPGITATGGKVTLKRCTVSGSLNFNNTTVELLRITNSAATIATANTGSGARFIMTQSSSGYLSVSGYSAWIGYNAIVPQAYFTDSDVVFVGNRVFNQFNTCGIGVSATRGTLKAFNNLIIVQGNNNYCDRQFRGLTLDSSVAEIVNDTIVVGINWVDNQGSGGYVVEAANSAKISLRGCILHLNSNVPQSFSNFIGIAGTPEQVSGVSYCDVYMVDGNWSPAPPQFSGGVVGLNCISADALFLPGDLLSPGSPCINAGPPDAIYNDRDGTRNDMGYTGGPLWNPGNYTNNLPMVFWLMPTNQTVLKGLQPTIPINAAATAGH